MTPDIFVFAEPQPKTHAEGDAAGYFDCAEAGGWLRQVPDGAVERMARVLHASCHKTADLGSEKHYLKDTLRAESLLAAALGEG